MVNSNVFKSSGIPEAGAYYELHNWVKRNRNGIGV